MGKDNSGRRSFTTESVVVQFARTDCVHWRSLAPLVKTRGFGMTPKETMNIHTLTASSVVVPTGQLAATNDNP
jgi:hypothetical protein